MKEFNTKALYDALKKIHDLVNSLDENCGVDPIEIRDIAREALAVPPRQCDVGTPDEQSERMEKSVCSKHHGCVRCPLRKTKYSDCSLGWAQTPYVAQEGGAE